MNVLKKQDLRKVALAICGRKGLNLTTDERHEIQLDVTGEVSLTDMSAPQLEDLVLHLRRLQKAATSTPAHSKTDDDWRFVFKLSPERRSYGKKIYRLAQRIGALQSPPVPVMSKAYIEGVAAKMRGCDQPLEFCDTEQLHKIVQALEVFLKRHGG